MNDHVSTPNSNLDFACVNCMHYPLIPYQNNLRCPSCLTDYPIKENVPILLPNMKAVNTNDANITQVGKIINTYDKAYKHDGIMGTDLDKIYDQVTKTILLQFSKPLDGKRILDVGAGVGSLWDYTPKNVHGYAIDPSLIGMMKVSERKPDLTVSVSIGEYIPYPGNFFDVIIAADTIEHTLDPTRALKEIHRTIKPDGDFCASFPIPNSLVKWGWNQIISRKIGIQYIYQTMKVILKRFWLFGNVFFQPFDRDLTLPQWKELLESSGFSTTEIILWPEKPEVPIVYLVHSKAVSD